MNKVIYATAAITLAAIASCSSSDEGSMSAIKAPTNLKAELLDGGAHLTWNDNSSDESEFMIERMAAKSDWSTLATVPFDTTQYHDASLVPGTRYNYRVMAMPKSGGHGEGAYSDEVTFVAPSGASGSGGSSAESSGEHAGHAAGAGGS